MACKLLFLIGIWLSTSPAWGAPQANFAAPSDTPRSEQKIDLPTVHKVLSSPGIPVHGDDRSMCWFDYQSNGGDEKRLWVLPDGNVYAI